jgi:hypothetical protein
VDPSANFLLEVAFAAANASGHAYSSSVLTLSRGLEFVFKFGKYGFQQAILNKRITIALALLACTPAIVPVGNFLLKGPWASAILSESAWHHLIPSLSSSLHPRLWDSRPETPASDSFQAYDQFAEKLRIMRLEATNALDYALSSVMAAKTFPEAQENSDPMEFMLPTWIATLHESTTQMQKEASALLDKLSNPPNFNNGLGLKPLWILLSDLKMGIDNLNIVFDNANATESASTSENLTKLIDESCPDIANVSRSVLQELVQGNAVVGANDVPAVVAQLVNAMEMEEHHRVALGPDYAAVAQGAEVVPWMTAGPYVDHRVPQTMRQWLRSLMGVHRYRFTPAQALSHEGENSAACYPFNGRSGHITVRLWKEVVPTHVIIYHSPRLIAPTPETAPKSFEVWGWKTLPSSAGSGIWSELWNPPPYAGETTMTSRGYEARLLGRGEYSFESPDAPSVQVFELQARRETAEGITLHITDNHGAAEYTCLYGFRVFSFFDE